MGYKKCPGCDVNYISDDMDLCPVCREKIKPKSNRTGNGRAGGPPGRNVPLTITAVAETGVSNNEYGFLAYDEQGRNIGVVFESGDPRAPRYRMAELCFYPQFKGELGTYRVILINGGYLPFERLKEILKTQGRFTCTTDAR